MASRPRKTPARKAPKSDAPIDEGESFDPTAPARRGPLTDFSQASERSETAGGFGEAPQADFDASEAFSGPIGSWAEAIERASETKAERGADGEE